MFGPSTCMMMYFDQTVGQGNVRVFSIAKKIDLPTIKTMTLLISNKYWIKIVTIIVF